MYYDSQSQRYRRSLSDYVGFAGAIAGLAGGGFLAYKYRGKIMGALGRKAKAIWNRPSHLTKRKPNPKRTQIVPRIHAGGMASSPILRPGMNRRNPLLQGPRRPNGPQRLQRKSISHGLKKRKF